MEKESVILAGKKERKHVRIPVDIYMNAADDWMDKLGYKLFGYWIKFHSWVDRSETRLCDQHIPYKLESVYEKLGVSETTFFRDIKPLWEFGLIDIIEFGDKKGGKKPRNIIVYEYPMNDINRKYEPLEKLRDWKKDYKSFSKDGGIKGALLKKISTKQNQPPKNDRLENHVDNNDFQPPKNDRLQPPKNDRFNLPNLGANNLINKLLIKINKDIKALNNNFLSLMDLELINEFLELDNFTEIEREKILIHIIKNDIKVSMESIKQQCLFMRGKKDIINRATYFINGIENNAGRDYRDFSYRQEEPEKYERKVPFYNWLEN